MYEGFLKTTKEKYLHRKYSCERQDEFAYQTDEFKETILTDDGISCAACAWLIEMQLSKVTGLININVNATTQSATVRWDNDSVQLSELINHIANIGYQALPFKASTAEQLNKTQRKNYIKRLGISGILMMQVMMIAFGLYFGAFLFVCFLVLSLIFYAPC